MRARSLVCLALLLASTAAPARQLDILGTSIDLPFDYEVVGSSELLTRSAAGVMRFQSIRIKRLDASARPEPMMVTASYMQPTKGDASVLQAKLHRQAENPAASAGVLSTSNVRIDGHDFIVQDGRDADTTYPHAMRWFGVVGGAVYGLNVSAADTQPLNAQLSERIGAIHIDQAALEKSGAQADAEGLVAVRDSLLQTPLGDIAVPKETDFRLIESFIARDGAGHPAFRRRIFGFGILGDQSPWDVRLPQIFSVDLGCGKQGALAADDYDQFILMSREQAIENPAQKFTGVKVEGSDTLLGLTAQTSTAEGPAVDTWRLKHLHIRRWAAKKDGDWFQFAANRYNGAPIENAMIKQLASAPPICRLDLPFGSNQAPVIAPPVAH